ncbi:hypothetical protein K8R66_04030, partial [bacterium]|nr:hypothetical protein [bacterium]
KKKYEKNIQNRQNINKNDEVLYSNEGYSKKIKLKLTKNKTDKKKIIKPKAIKIDTEETEKTPPKKIKIETDDKKTKSKTPKKRNLKIKVDDENKDEDYIFED